MVAVVVNVHHHRYPPGKMSGKLKIINSIQTNDLLKNVIIPPNNIKPSSEPNRAW